jgi:hypothetical protein
MIVRSFALMLLMTTAASAQTVSPGLEHANPEMAGEADRRDVRRRVEEFLKKLGSRDIAGVRAMLAPKVLIAVARQRPATEGQATGYATTYQTGEEFIAALEKSAGQPGFEEPLNNVRVTVNSGTLAYVRADFRVVRGGKVVSSGVDHFTLMKEPDGWKIAFVAYTSNPAPQR